VSAWYRYELWLGGNRIAKYKTLGQALLGARWRSRKHEKAIYVWSAREPYRFIAEVRAGVDGDPV
jgi:hypothetical protein